MGPIVVKSTLRMLTLYMCFNESGISGSETIMYLNICHRYLIFSTKPYVFVIRQYYGIVSNFF